MRNKKIMEEKQKYIAEIKRAMAEKKISNEILSNNVGCSRVTIWRFLEQGLDINWFTFVNIMKFLNLKIL